MDTAARDLLGVRDDKLSALVFSNLQELTQVPSVLCVAVICQPIVSARHAARNRLPGCGPDGQHVELAAEKDTADTMPDRNNCSYISNDETKSLAGAEPSRGWREIPVVEPTGQVVSTAKQ